MKVVRAKQNKTKAITVIHNYKPYRVLCTNSCISKQILLNSEITRQFAFILIQKNSKYFNRPNKGNSTLLLFVFLIDGKTEAENINGS